MYPLKSPNVEIKVRRLIGAILEKELDTSLPPDHLPPSDSVVPSVKQMSTKSNPAHYTTTEIPTGNTFYAKDGVVIVWNQVTNDVSVSRIKIAIYLVIG